MKRYLPFILIIISMAIFFFVIDPQYNQVQNLLKEKESNDTMLQLAEDLQRKRDRLHDAFNSISVNEREELQKLLPDTVDNVRLILDINNIAEQYGVIIKNISVTREDDGNNQSQKNVVSSIERQGDIGTISLSFSMNATYDVFINFMKDLEEALRIVDIRSLDVSARQGDNVFLGFHIDLDTYWLR
jgi:Tfp pilus assembly protein PilO